MFKLVHRIAWKCCRMCLTLVFFIFSFVYALSHHGDFDSVFWLLPPVLYSLNRWAGQLSCMKNDTAMRRPQNSMRGAAGRWRGGKKSCHPSCHSGVLLSSGRKQSPSISVKVAHQGSPSEHICEKYPTYSEGSKKKSPHLATPLFAQEFGQSDNTHP